MNDQKDDTNIDKVTGELLERANLMPENRERLKYFLRGVVAGKIPYELFSGEEMTFYLAIHPEEILKYSLWFIGRFLLSTRRIIQVYIKSMRNNGTE